MRPCASLLRTEDAAEGRPRARRVPSSFDRLAFNLLVPRSRGILPGPSIGARPSRSEAKSARLALGGRKPGRVGSQKLKLNEKCTAKHESDPKRAPGLKPTSRRMGPIGR